MHTSSCSIIQHNVNLEITKVLTRYIDLQARLNDAAHPYLVEQACVLCSYVSGWECQKSMVCCSVSLAWVKVMFSTGLLKLSAFLSQQLISMPLVTFERRGCCLHHHFPPAWFSTKSPRCWGNVQAKLQNQFKCASLTVRIHTNVDGFWFVLALSEL